MNEMPRLPPPTEHKLLSPPEASPDGTAPNRTREDHKTRRVPRLPLFGALVVLVAMLAWGVFSHIAVNQQAAATQQNQADYRPALRTAVAQRQDGPVKLTLPGTTLPFDQANIYARATGYIAERHVDIGSRVHQGDLLVRIAAPDLDAQLTQAAAQLGQTRAALLQANAQVDQARANLKLANVTNFRTGTLANQGWETRQNADNAATNLNTNTAGLESALAGVKVAEANFKAQEATVQRLEQLTQYEKVTAPFDGVVTARNVDQGDLVAADAGSGTPMFTVQHDDVIRTQTYVPQSGALGLQTGLKAGVMVPEMPGRVFAGTVARTAIALDPNSRTLLTQVDVPNTEHVLHPGTYVDIAFDIPRAHPGVVIPAEAVLFGADGLRVAVVGDDDHVHMRKIVIRRDFGTSVELSDGLEGGENVALSPPVDIHDGQAVTHAK